MTAWTFEQIEGRGARKKLTLEGWNAPFGRPRKDPVFREIIRSRIQTTHYPGSDKQTRHAFGVNWEPTEIKGRWMTKANLEQTANDIADDWVAFMRDERTCRISWGVVVSWTGYIEELELARESEHEIAWRMKLQIDRRDDVVKRKIPAQRLLASTDLGTVNDFVTNTAALRLPIDENLSPDFLDSLDNLAAALNTPSAELNKLAGRFDDLEKASFATLQHFRSAVSGFKTALLTMRETIMSAQLDDLMLVRTPESDMGWSRYTLAVEDQSYIALDALGRLERTADLAKKKDPTVFVTAREGDTWEKISVRATGGPDKAGAIRELNGIQYGERPTQGESYLVE